MNSVALVGRLTSKAELRYTNSNIPVTRFTLAVRKSKDETDFINCIAWRSNAEFISKYTDKGQQIGINGRIQTGSYEKDGKKTYTFDVVVENITLISVEGKGEQVKGQSSNYVEEKMETNPFADFGEQVSIDDSFLD